MVGSQAEKSKSCKDFARIKSATVRSEVSFKRYSIAFLFMCFIHPPPHELVTEWIRHS